MIYRLLRRVRARRRLKRMRARCRHCGLQHWYTLTDSGARLCEIRQARLWQARRQAREDAKPGPKSLYTRES